MGKRIQADSASVWSSAQVLAQVEQPHRKIALELGCSRARVTNMLRLGKLPEDVQAWVRRGQLTVSHAMELVGLPRDRALELAMECLNRAWSTRQLRSAVKALRAGAPIPEDPNIRALCTRLGELLGANVTLKYRPDRSGVLGIEFADLECLDGVLDRLGYTP